MGATAPEKGASSLPPPRAAGTLCSCKTNSDFHKVSSCITLFALGDKMHGAGLCFWFNSVQYKFRVLGLIHTMMNCWFLWGK